MKIEKEVAELRKIYDKIKNKFEKENLKLEQRDQLYGERSEKWQESEKGIEYEHNSQILAGDLDNFEVDLDNLDNVITEISAMSEGSFDTIS